MNFRILHLKQIFVQGHYEIQFSKKILLSGDRSKLSCDAKFLYGIIPVPFAIISRTVYCSSSVIFFQIGLKESCLTMNCFDHF